MKRWRAWLGRLRAHTGGGAAWRFWVLGALVLWLFMPPPQDSLAACAPWEGGPCIDVHPPSGGGERPGRERDDGDGEPSPRSSGPGCASVPSRPSSSDSGPPPSPAPGTPHATWPHVIWSENGTLKAEAGYRWVNENDPNDLRVEPLPEGTPHGTLPHVVWAGNGRFHPAPGYRWLNDAADDFGVEPLPDGTPHPTLPNVVWSGDGQHFHPAPGYVWRKRGDPNDFQVVRDVTVASWSSEWGDEDQDIAVDALRGMKDETLRNWLAAHVEFGRFPDDKVSPLSASGSTLRFKDAYFARNLEPAQRENLLAFEGGKVFYEMTKDVPVAGGQTFERWFFGFYGAHMAVISDMAAASHQGQSLGTSDLLDAHSAFGHLFRAQALELDIPAGYERRGEWDDVQREFGAQLERLVRSQ